MKRSHEPVFWSLFGAGGMLSALTGCALVFVTGIGVPLALWLSPGLMRYENMQAFVDLWAGKLAIFAVIVLFLWHATLRILLLLHDFGLAKGLPTRLIGNGLALLCTLFTAYLLFPAGF
ncbi:MAG: fumarate reductase subunit D [Gammaproteobacteria bacterium]